MLTGGGDRKFDITFLIILYLILDIGSVKSVRSGLVQYDSL